MFTQVSILQHPPDVAPDVYGECDANDVSAVRSVKRELRNVRGDEESQGHQDEDPGKQLFRHPAEIKYIMVIIHTKDTQAI